MDREKIAGVTPEQIRAFRLRAHHLDRKLPPGALEAAASVCGFQNSPPGAWETALWNRVEGCTLQAAEYLETHTVTRKEALDAALAEIVEAALPAEKLPLWRAPSMYGPRQTVGGAVVSFMLRPCAFRFRVVFGARDGIHPTFTSFRRWTGHMPAVPTDAEKRLVQKFLHAHGPADVSAFRSAHAHSGRRRSPSRAVWGLTGRRRYGIITSRYYDKARRGLPPPLSRGRTGARNPLERGCLFP